jgi:hypothetical protein
MEVPSVVSGIGAWLTRANSRGPTLPRSITVRLRGFPPPCRLAPPMPPGACCISRPTLGFTAFRPSWRRVPATSGGVPVGATPSRAFPSVTARRASPRGGTSSSFAAREPRDLEAFPCRSPWPDRPVAGPEGSMLSWASLARRAVATHARWATRDPEGSRHDRHAGHRPGARRPARRTAHTRRRGRDADEMALTRFGARRRERSSCTRSPYARRPRVADDGRSHGRGTS